MVDAASRAMNGVTRHRHGARAAGRGTLTIFLGASSGAGQALAMLQEAELLRDVEGRDVVVGAVATRGHLEIATLLSGLERLPGPAGGPEASDELDLDAALARRPSLLVLDELARPNRAGARHARRWQDAEELLAAGIDVYATLDVRNVESLSDVVAEITGVAVEDAAPDASIDAARIKLVDAPASDRILVCVGPSASSQSLLRAGRRMASGLRAKWYAATVQTPATRRMSGADRARLSDNLRTAERLGAETVTLTGERATEELLRFARERNVTRILVGKPRVRRLRDRLGRSFVDELLLGSGEIDIYATVGEPELGPARASPGPPARERGLHGYVAAVAAAAVATLVALAVFGRADPAAVVMTYLFGTVVVAMRFDFRASVASALLSVVCFDYFFVPHYFTLGVSDLRHVVTFAVMLSVAVVVASLTQRVREQADVAQRSERRTELLYAMTRELSRTEGPGAILEVASRHLADVFESRIAVLSIDADEALSVLHAPPRFDAAVEVDAEAVRWVVKNRRSAGAGTSTLARSPALHVPLASASGEGAVLGVLVFLPADPARFADIEQQRLVDAFAAQITMALERARLAEENERVRVAVEAEQLRSALLGSVSHDLRTPLAVMRGVASTLVDDDDQLSKAARRELSSALLEETERLERQVRNLLDMTRLESGPVHLHREWQPLEEVIGAAWTRVESRLAGREVSIRAPADVEACFDGVLVEQVLVNLLENAARYGPAGTSIDVEASRAEGEVVVEVADRGPGVPLDEREHVFDKFRRGRLSRGDGGVGLGLAICRAIVEAHGGRIWVQGREGGGASFRFSLPSRGGPPPAGALPELVEPRETSS